MNDARSETPMNAKERILGKLRASLAGTTAVTERELGHLARDLDPGSAGGLWTW